MSLEQIRKIGAIGTGTMCTSLLPYAMAGYPVHLFSSNADSLVRGMDANKNALLSFRDHNLITTMDVEDVLERITPTTDFDEAFADADLIVESGIEKLEVKHALYTRFDQRCKHGAIIGTNSSSLLPSQIASVVSPERQGYILGLHSFNPPHLESLIEVIMGPQTLPETARTVVELVSNVGKDPLLLKKEIQGGFVNRMQAAILREFFYMAAEGILGLEEMDSAIKILARRWMERGPVLIAFFGGFDVFDEIINNVAPGLCAEPRSPKRLANNVVNGHLGLKKGGGGDIYPELSPERAADILIKWKGVLLQTLAERKAVLIGDSTRPGIRSVHMIPRAELV